LALGSQGQGVATRKSEAQARLASSGHPVSSPIYQLGWEARLVSPIVCGEGDHKDYILEAVGCVCAFFDYDNDAWMDISLLSGSFIFLYRIMCSSTPRTFRSRVKKLIATGKVAP